MGKKIKNIWLKAILLALLVLVTACGPKVLEPGIYDKELHSTYMPFGDTAFLIPNETWLKRFAVNAATKEIDYIQLHATVDGQPWSEKVHDRMYPGGGFQGDRLEVVIKFHSPYEIEKRKKRIKRFKTVPYSIEDGDEWISILSSYQGWKTYQRLRKSSIGRSTYNPIIYVFEENDEVKYLMGDFVGEKIIFAYNDYALVEILFSPFRQDEQMARAIQTAEFFRSKLSEFEQAGLEYQKKLNQQQNKEK
ncbi:Hypothetical protein F387_02031 [Wohlfahrtiimonas chitiniclastica SH04]|uniref:Lipoprotein n=2 Tax=Wohlfahrtiimonas chitiniclastica TaxID=400946 RepID=L8XTH8_9GAMM|nr:hypothetical protein [Wohlfahrtiimonas chitiniclastica]ELV07212.1 Hypothetical protein F387_02031 [Wohlfahrtiimonas chitiniclastica SH04]MBS7821605.1 hypothetical protein [Wohlfahrtiimonas chitiniclastica]